MFRINDNVKLNIKQFLILLIIIFALFLLYNKLYINSYYLPITKYKSMSKKYKQLIVQYQNKLEEVEQKLQLPILSPNPPSNPNINTLPTINPNELNNTNPAESNHNSNCGPNGCVSPKLNHINQPSPLDEDGQFINNIETYIADQTNSQTYSQYGGSQQNNQGYSQINGYDTLWNGTSSLWADVHPHR